MKTNEEEFEETKPSTAMKVIGWIIFSIGILVWFFSVTGSFLSLDETQLIDVAGHIHALLISLLGLLMVVGGKLHN